MKKGLFGFLVLIVVTGLQLNAQCNFNEMLDSLKTQIANDEILLEDFSVALHRSDSVGSVPMARFSIKFDKETTYRFRIFSDQINYEPCAILQVLEGSILKGNNYNMKQKKCYDSFDFNNPFNRDGEIVIYFVDGKNGCAVATVSKVIKTDLD